MLLTALKRLRGTGSQVEPSSVVYKRVGTPGNRAMSRCAQRLTVRNVGLHTINGEIVGILSICAALLKSCTGGRIDCYGIGAEERMQVGLIVFGGVYYWVDIF